MLSEILSVPGKPGLFKLVSRGKQMIVAESLIDHKRIPVYVSDRFVLLSDINIIAENDELSLGSVFRRILEKQNGQALDPPASAEDMKEWFSTIIPDFDRVKVYPSDIKKIIVWYNLLLRECPEVLEESEEKTETPDDPNQPEANA
jgi:hypothetical protein